MTLDPRLLATRNPCHPVRDYLSSLTWDGTPRLDSGANVYFGAEKSEYSRIVFAKTLIAAVARIFVPGCKVDTMLIFEGLQGGLKSGSINALFGDDWFTDELPDLTNKDAAMQLNGAWCAEVAELDAMSRSEVGVVKKFIARRVDRYRPPYGKATVDVPRQAVFIATTNEDTYLKDQTGNRRFWPVKNTRADIEAIRRDRDQLWAEAVTRYHKNEPWWLTEKQEATLARPEQDERREIDPWESPITTW